MEWGDMEFSKVEFGIEFGWVGVGVGLEVGRELSWRWGGVELSWSWGWCGVAVESGDGWHPHVEWA